MLVYNGTLVGENQPEWQENDTVTFQCARGYELIGPSGFTYGAGWSVTCEPTDIDAGSASSTSYSNITWSEEPQEFTCSSKLNAPQHVLFFNTLINFIYIGVDCGLPPSIINGSVSLSTPNTTNLFSTAQYTCKAGYQLNGTGYSTCWSDGVWRPIFTCISASKITNTKVVRLLNTCSYQQLSLIAELPQ